MRMLSIVVIIVFASIIGLSSIDFVVARGSDAGVQIFSPSDGWKLAAGLICAALIVAFARTRSKTRVPGVCLIVALLVAGSASHNIVLNHKSGMLETHWLLVKFERLHFDVAEGISHEWRVEGRALGVRWIHRSKDISHFVFTGVPPWTIDLQSVASF